MHKWQRFSVDSAAAIVGLVVRVLDHWTWGPGFVSVWCTFRHPPFCEGSLKNSGKVWEESLPCALLWLWSWSHFDIMSLTIMSLMGRLSEKGVLVGLAVYEYINPRQRVVRCGNENPRAQRKFELCKSREVEFWTLIARCCTKSWFPL